MIQGDKRSFTIVKVRINGKAAGHTTSGGVYTTKSAPSAAARKACSRLCRTHKVKKCDMRITIKETTRGSKGKEYTYDFKRIKLAVPVIGRGGAECHYTSKIKAVKK